MIVRTIGTFFCAALLVFCFSLPLIAQEDDPVTIFNLAQDAHERGDLKSAKELYLKAIDLTESFPEANLQLGNLFAENNQNADAEKYLKKAIEERPDWSLAKTSLAKFYLRVSRAEEARKIAAALNIEEPDDFHVYTVLTAAKLQTEITDAEIKAFLSTANAMSNAIEKNYFVLFTKSNAEIKIGDLRAARATIAKLLRLKPDNKEVRSSFISVLIADGDLDAAASEISTFEKTYGNSDALSLLKANLSVAGGNYPDAIAALKLIKTPTKEVLTLRDKLELQSSFDVFSLKEKLKQEPQNLDVNARLCSILRVKAPQEALVFCKTAATLAPNNAAYVIGYAGAALQLRDFNTAASILSAVLKIVPENYTARAYYATALFELDKYAEAKVEFEKLLAVRQENAVTYYFLGICNDKIKDFPAALASYQQFLKLADATKNKLEIEKVELRLPILQRQIKNKD